MSDTIIKVEGLGKKYTISHEKRDGYTSLRDVISNKVKGILRSKKDDFVAKEDFWALKDVNFEVKQGDAVGIIGRNGAGKSTLLKILSRITEPTHGRIELNGRVASLLEVGTGFHPELTGKENIYLNGAILGMSRLEIKRKFDEIVDFSGVEKFLDTPVKRYSSGMYVRLAFSVAAHLEPEILVVDEVLAVGDAEFQKKCLGKMDDASKKEGRTVLFVSHNTSALSNVCNSGILLEHGEVSKISNISSIISHYLYSNASFSNFLYVFSENESTLSGVMKLVKMQLQKKENDEFGPNIIVLSNIISVTVEFEVNTDENEINIGVEIFNIEGTCIIKLASESIKKPGKYEASFDLPGNLLNDDIYTIDVYAIKDRSLIMLFKKRAIQFEVKEVNRSENWYGKWIGIIRPHFPFKIKAI